MFVFYDFIVCKYKLKWGNVLYLVVFEDSVVVMGVCKEVD